MATDPEDCEFAHLRGIHEYSEGPTATPADRAHSINIVAEWLDLNSQRFTIPGSEWGRELHSALGHVLGMAQEHANAHRQGA